MLTYVLFGLSICSLVLFLIFRDKNNSTFAITLKTATSLLFVFMGLSACYYNIKGAETVKVENVHVMLLMIGGLVCGLIGDITLDFKVFFKALNRVHNNEFVKDHGIMTNVGMSVFGLGHILYMVSLLYRYPNDWNYLLFAVLIALVLTAAIFLVSIFVLKMNFRNYLIISIIYSIILSTFIVYSLFLYANYHTTNLLILFIGSVLFILSDLFLSMTYFSKEQDYTKEGITNPESKLMIVINHCLYYSAQFLIALSILFII